DWLHLPDGLAAIASHAKGLGYEAVVLLLDELILWLTFHFSNRDFFGHEIQKLTGFVESSQGRMAIPVVSFIARQHDLKAWKDSSVEAGEAARTREQLIANQEGRFSAITLGSANLPQIAHRRLLMPRDRAAAEALQTAFDTQHLTSAVKPILLDKVNTDDHHRGSSEEDFRLTYPFSPVLIDTLINLSSAMQRDRTALKVMESMLVDLADTMTVNQVIPVGEVLDYIIDGNKTGHADESVAARFRTARTLWREKLRPAGSARPARRGTRRCAARCAPRPPARTPHGATAPNPRHCAPDCGWPKPCSCPRSRPRSPYSRHLPQADGPTSTTGNSPSWWPV